MFVTGVAAALFLAGGFVLQQHVASQEPPQEALHLGLLLDLVRRPLWLAGIAAMVVGQVLGATALDHGSLALVEPLLAANLLFALPLSAAWRRQRLAARDWVGAVALVVGLAAFVAIGRPHGGDSTHLGWPNWAIAGGTMVAVALALTLVAVRLPRAPAATTLGAGAGVLYGLQDALTRSTLQSIGSGITGLFLHWYVYVLVAVALYGLLLAQSAFEAAPLAASLPAITIGEPIAGIAFGVGVFGEGINLSPLPFAGELVGIVLMVAGLVVLARSPVVVGGAGAGEPLRPHPYPEGVAESTRPAERT